MLFDHIINKICNLRIEDVILISDSTILLDYGLESLHAVDSRSRTRAFGVSL